jgi:hypothetical protein
MMNAPGARENACTRGVVYTLVDFTLTQLAGVWAAQVCFSLDRLICFFD